MKKKKISPKGLQKKIWAVLREAVILRDGKKCQIKGCNEKTGLQVDHCFSRRCKSLFFDIRNLTTLCQSHHYSKSIMPGGAIDKLVDEIVREREGSKWWDEAIRLSQIPNPDFSKIWWLETELASAKMHLVFYRDYQREKKNV